MQPKHGLVFFLPGAILIVANLQSQKQGSSVKQVATD